MLAEERRNRIMTRLSASGGQVLAADLVKEFRVSEDTIRRDLKDLADAGLLKKVHGGALALTSVPFEYSSRQNLNLEAKSNIALRAVQLVRDNMLVFIDGGTTCAQLPYQLPTDLNATFVTHSIATAMALSALKRSKTILLGGTIISDLLIATGPELLEQANKFRPELSIISVHGMTAAEGLTVESWEDAQVKSAFIKNSAETVVLAGKEKIGFISPYAIASVGDVSYLISDSPAELLEPFKTAGLTVWCV
jgi:DeoR/GlpR family transcriptional regulator of sugar metabolism